MREEIAAAVVFLARLIRQNDGIPKEKAEEFSDHLSALLVEKFKNHWYAEKPYKGQGYRCIRVNPAEPIDPVLKKAATLCGLQYNDLGLPTELTVWVDPQEVCCRFGETHGSFCMLTSLKDGNLENQAHKIDIQELVQEQQKRNNKHINIVTTRININMPRPLHHKNLPLHLTPSPAQGNHPNDQMNQYQQNFFHNSQHYSGFNPPPFHNNTHKNHNKGSFRGNYGGYQGNKAYGFNQNYRSGNQMNSVTNPNLQGKDKFHWIRSTQHRGDHMKVSSH